MKKNNKGFTLAELLVVVAIIAVLVAISIPIFTTQLEKAREATDAANIRAAYAEMLVAVLDETSPAPVTIDLAQTQANWENEPDWPENMSVPDKPVAGANKAVISWDSTHEKVVVTISAKSST